MLLWRSLEHVRGWAGVRAVWQEHMGEQLAFLDPLLRPIEEHARSFPMPGGDDDLRIVVHAEDDIVAVDPETGETSPLKHEDIVIWKLDAEALMRGVAEALGLVGTPSSVGMGDRLWWLGDFTPVEGVRFPVYLATSRDAREVVSSGGYVAALTTSPLILVTPTRSAAGPALDTLLVGGRVAWLALEGEVEWDGEAAFRLRRPLREALHGFLKKHAPIAVDAVEPKRFPTPPGATWSGVSMSVVDGHTMQVRIGDLTRRLTFHDMGLEDRRTKSPSVQFELLMAFADAHGLLTWSSPAATRQNQKRRERLAAQLSAYFGIDDDPFLPDGDGWCAKFSIAPGA